MAVAAYRRLLRSTALAFHGTPRVLDSGIRHKHC